MKITNDVLKGYLNCKTKGYLKLVGETGAKSDYEAMTDATGQAARENALAKLAASFGEAGCNEPATDVTLKEGKPLLLGVTLEVGALSLSLDALRRADGLSLLGDHHYLPVLHILRDKLGQRERLLLAVFGLALEGVQGTRPETGLVTRGAAGRLDKIRLDTKFYLLAEQVLEELKRLQPDSKPPKLLLNDHCQVCEFRQRCHNQAVQEDSLSLLRGIGEKEIKSLGRKGVLTLTQLAHTFRPKRKGKRQERKTGRHFHALKALAIRDKKIYILGVPQFPDKQTQIYLDIEGVPEEGLVYLIGLTVQRGF